MSLLRFTVVLYASASFLRPYTHSIMRHILPIKWAKNKLTHKKQLKIKKELLTLNTNFMKRITKQNLNDLAKVMPVLNEQQQFENVGGTYYVSTLSFMELGYVGYGDEIYVANDFEWELAQQNNGGYGTPLAEADSSTQIRVWAQYVYLKNGFSGSVTIEGNNSGFPVRFLDGTLYFNIEEIVTLTYKSTLMIALDSVDSAIRAYMAANGSGSNSGNTSGSTSGSNSGSLADEEAALEAELVALNNNNINYWNDSEQNFRLDLAQRFNNLWQKQGKTGTEYTIYAAYIKCKVLPHYYSTDLTED